jgi:Cyclic nucleotide-binding domain
LSLRGSDAGLPVISFMFWRWREINEPRIVNQNNRQIGTPRDMPFIMLRQSTREHALPTTMEAGLRDSHNRARPERVGGDEHFDFVRSCHANTGTKLAACGLILNAGPSMQAYAASSSVMSHRSGAAHPSTSHSNGAQSLLLTDSVNSIGGPPPLLAGLSQSEREHVLAHGRKRVFYRGQTLFNQGAKHDGIYLIESGRIRVFYMAPSQREITLAYWLPGNFVGGPETARASTNGPESRAATAASFIFPAGTCASSCSMSRASRSA